MNTATPIRNLCLEMYIMVVQIQKVRYGVIEVSHPQFIRRCMHLSAWVSYSTVNNHVLAKDNPRSTSENDINVYNTEHDFRSTRVSWSTSKVPTSSRDKPVRHSARFQSNRYGDIDEKDEKAETCSRAERILHPWWAKLLGKWQFERVFGCPVFQTASLLLLQVKTFPR